MKINSEKLPKNQFTIRQTIIKGKKCKIYVELKILCFLLLILHFMLV